ncbi:MAG TPA: GAF and ANTAR domain-containing protein [Iamia sp.]|nr:GAF and ANTAR domain-containing protein [Iamia sp.]
MGDRELVQYFAELARRFMADGSVDGTMRLIVHSAVELVDGCHHASISRRRGRSLVSASSSDEIGLILDGIQTGAQEGPCLDAIESGEIMASDDLEADARWPVYGPRAVESVGVRSSMALPLHDGERTIGALNLFSEQTGTFRPDADDVTGEAIASVLAAHATPALVAAVERADLRAALESRDVIGQAKGILMARTGIDEDAAFDLLRRASQRLNIKLAVVARRLVDGKLADDPDADV